MRFATHGEDESAVPGLLVLWILVLIAGIGALAALIESVSLTQDRSAAPSQPRTSACRACGVVDSVREVAHQAPRHEVSTVAGGGPEGFAVLLAALGGMLQRGPAEVYEVVVRMDDGSLRAMREPSRPQWRPGDRVRVVKGTLQAAPASETHNSRIVGARCVAGEGERVLIAWANERYYCLRQEPKLEAHGMRGEVVSELRAANDPD